MLIEPAKLVKLFGKGEQTDAENKWTTFRYHFEDSDYSSFLIYDYKQTTKYEQNQKKYDYEN